MSSGSYRIWVHDLSLTFSEIGVISKVVNSVEDVEADADIIILCKSCYRLCDNVKEKNNNAIVGAINIPCDYSNDNIDFVIVGSIEEYTSMSNYKNVFIYPLIERKFENVKIPKHLKKKSLDICFHGHFPHLFKFESSLKNALETFDNMHAPINLKVITGNKNFNWVHGRPNINIEMYDYNDSFVNIVQSCDIGLVPNVCDMKVLVNGLEKQTSVELGLYETDYFIRMKNKTNPGRAYVFYQLGIPVIHDLSPSSFELMCKTGYNICAHDTKSYIREFKRLLNPDYRNEVAEKNKMTFEKHYNVRHHAKKLIKNIGEVYE